MKKQLRIAYISEMRMPTERAHGIQIMRTCESLSLSGAEVTLYYSRRKQSNKSLENVNPYEYFGVTENFTIKDVYYLDVLVIEKFIKPILNPMMFLANAFFAITSMSVAKKWNPDIYYTRHWLCATVLILLGNPVGFELHRAGSNEFTVRALKIISLLSKSKNMRFISTISNELKTNLLSLGVSKNKIFVLPDALPNYNLQKKSKSNASENDVVYTGHLVRGRGVDILLKAAKLLPKVRFTIVGGNEKDRDNLLKTFQPDKNVTFVNHIPPSDVKHYQVSAKILVLPQTDIHGQSPLKLFEYIASKKPIIATNLSPIMEILEDEFSALLFNPGDFSQLAKCISKLLDDDRLRNYLSENASQKYKHWTWENRSKKIINIIESGQQHL